MFFSLLVFCLFAFIILIWNAFGPSRPPYLTLDQGIVQLNCRFSTPIKLSYIYIMPLGVQYRFIIQQRKNNMFSLAWVEDALILIQDELHYLVLEDHVHGDVGRLHLGSEQRWAEYDCHVLHSHAVVLPILNNPVSAKNDQKLSPEKSYFIFLWTVWWKQYTLK